MFPQCSDGDTAAEIARRLIEIEYRGHGDLVGALRRLEGKTGISYWTWLDWRNCGSRPSAAGVLTSTWNKLVTAYQIECARQITLFEKELKRARSLGGDEDAADSILVRAAAAVAGRSNSQGK